ncbi:hypothetical protein RLIN73S_03113 [Rhodanobacter lindaniclasticus]
MEASFCAPPRSEVLPCELTVNTMPGTVSANSRKLRVSCGMVSIWCSDTVEPTSGVVTSGSTLAVTVTPERLTALAAPAGVAAARFRVEVEATVRVTVCSVPGPASTLYVPGCRPVMV